MKKTIKYQLVSLLLCVVLASILKTKYSILINATASLGNWAFIVKKGVKPSKPGQYIAFTPPANPYYTDTFIKMVGGVAGDEVTAINNIYYVNEQKIGPVKDKTIKGDILYPGPVGVIPKEHYFVYTSHKDSYDSRYSQIGWLPADLIIGTAIPVL